MGGRAASRLWRDVDEIAPRFLNRRLRIIPWVIIAGNLAFAAADPLVHRANLLPLGVLKLAIVAVQIAALHFVRSRPPSRWAVAAGLLAFATGASGGAAAGIITHDAFTTPMLCMAGALTTAAVVPWGAAAQSGAALGAALASGATLAGTVGLGAAGYPLVAIAFLAALSVYIARELSRQRAAEARAMLELHRHQAELAHVLRVQAMGEMAAQLAHELTQPLGAIANYAAGCRRRLQTTATESVGLIDAVEKIGSEALRAGEIIRRLRDFVRKDEPRWTPVNVNDLVREVVEFVAVEARENDVRLELALAPALPRVEMDPIQIEQVVINLVRNALEAMRDAPGWPATLSIDTRAAHPAGGIEVAVRDSGPGIPEGRADTIFEPFHTTKVGGLGMGLAISRSIVEAHGGRLWLTPNADRGTTFHFTLPIERPPWAPAASAELEPARGAVR